MSFNKASYETYAGHQGHDVLVHDTPFLAGDMVYKFLANTAGSTDLVVDATSTAGQNFYYQSPAGTTTHIMRCCIMMQDVGITGVKFAGLSELTNGIKVQVIDADGSTTVLDFLGGQTIKSNQNLAALAGGDIGTEGAGQDTALFRWTIRNAGACLRLNPLERFQITIQDDLTGIDEFQWMVQGIKST